MSGRDVPGLRREVLDFVELAHDSRPLQREKLFLRVSGLLQSRYGDLNTSERNLMSDILGRLIHDVEMEFRRGLAEKLARTKNAPRELVVLLANDEIQIARPLLLESNMLNDETLIEVVRHRTLQHQLAVAARGNLSEPVSDALADTGNEHAILALLRNDEAQISTKTMSRLATESRQTVTFQEPLLRRLDLPTHLAVSMYAWVSTALRRHIVENFEVDSEALETMIEKTKSGLQLVAVKEAAKPSTAQTMIDRLHKENRLTAGFLIRTLEMGEISLFELAFARFLGLRVPLLRRLIYDRGWEGVALAARAAGLEAPDGCLVLETIGRARHRDEALISREARLLEDLFLELPMDKANTIVRDALRGRTADIFPLIRSASA